MVEIQPISLDVVEQEPSLAELELLLLKEDCAESEVTPKSATAQADPTLAIIKNTHSSSITPVLLSDHQVSHKIAEHQKISDLVMQQFEEKRIDAKPMQHQPTPSQTTVDPFAWHQQQQSDQSETQQDLKPQQNKNEHEPSKVKTKLAYKIYKPKKARKEKKQFNPWLIVGMVVILILVNVGVMGYNKFQNYQQEQAAKAQLYLLEQERIIEEQRRKHGKLPNKILSDRSLDELLGKDRNQKQPQHTENRQPNYFVGSTSNTSQNKNAQFKCDGRTHCTQMKSYEEAVYFLKNCPGTKMDGNHDGQPCEQQFNRD